MFCRALTHCSDAKWSHWQKTSDVARHLVLSDPNKGPRTKMRIKHSGC